MIAFAVVAALLVFEIMVLNNEVQNLRSQLELLESKDKLNTAKIERLEIMMKAAITATGSQELIKILVRDKK